MGTAKRFLILSALALTACATPVYRNSFATGDTRFGGEQINAERTDAYSKLMRFQAWILNLTRFQW